jgi:hypothetical protein
MQARRRRIPATSAPAKNNAANADPSSVHIENQWSGSNGKCNVLGVSAQGWQLRGTRNVDRRQATRGGIGAARSLEARADEPAQTSRESVLPGPARLRKTVNGEGKRGCLGRGCYAADLSQPPSAKP